jgi:hypothetical protein
MLCKSLESTAFAFYRISFSIQKKDGVDYIKSEELEQDITEDMKIDKETRENLWQIVKKSRKWRIRI